MLGWILSLRSYTKERESIKYFRKQCFGFSSNLGIVFFWNLLAALRFVLYVNHSVIQGITMITHASQTKSFLGSPLSSLKRGFLIPSSVNYYFLNGSFPKTFTFKTRQSKNLFKWKWVFHSSIYNTHKWSQSIHLLLILRGSGL